MSGKQIAGLCFLIAAALQSGMALANPPPILCTNLPRYGWVSSEEIEARLKRAGFQLLRLRITNEACYAALVTNSAGQMQELRIHPGTSEVLPPDELTTGSVRP